MKIKIAAATSTCGVISVDGRVPWHCPGELEHFKQLTLGDGNNAVIMGKNTLAAIGNKPLTGRRNFVVSKTLAANDIPDGIRRVGSLGSALAMCDKAGVDEAWVIGGHNLYFEAMGLADVLHLSMMGASFINPAASVHTYFPLFSDIVIASAFLSSEDWALEDRGLYAALTVNLDPLRAYYQEVWGASVS